MLDSVYDVSARKGLHKFPEISLKVLDINLLKVLGIDVIILNSFMVLVLHLFVA